MEPACTPEESKRLMTQLRAEYQNLTPADRLVIRAALEDLIEQYGTGAIARQKKGKRQK